MRFSDLDFHREFLESAVDLVDARLDRIDLEALESPDPDSFGVFDRAEYLTGLGFAACQTYLVATIGRRVDRAQALELGPMHVCGRPIAALVNAAANHWKHSPEWSLDAPSRQSQRTLETLSALGIDLRAPYPLTNALHAILQPHNATFSRLIPFLTQWRELLRQRPRAV